MSTSNPPPPPGWYPDPAGGPALRWWDGNQWTGHLSPDPQAGQQPPWQYQPPSKPYDDVTHWLIPTNRSPWAIAAGYAGLLSLVVCPGPIALILGLVALRDINRTGKGGKGRAWFGIVMGSLAILAFLALFVGNGLSG